MKRPCIECGTVADGTRCTRCRKARERARNAARPHYDSTWRRISAAARRAQPWCTRCHATEDLTVDHVDPRSLSAGVQVLCRVCNAVKGDRTP